MIQNNKIMEFKGTKGEWNIVDDGNTLETEITCGKTRITQVKHYNTNNTGFFKNDPMINEGQANAQLIAAAPELLEALQLTQVEIAKYKTEHRISGHLSKCEYSIQQAINKALGL